MREFRAGGQDPGRFRPTHANYLLWLGRDHPEPYPRQRVDPLRIGKRCLLKPELVIPLFPSCAFRLELLNLIPVPHALEMLPREKQHKKKNQYAQSEETEKFTATIQVDFPHEAGIVDPLNEVEFREMRPARCRSASQTPSELR